MDGVVLTGSSFHGGLRCVHIAYAVAAVATAAVADTVADAAVDAVADAVGDAVADAVADTAVVIAASVFANSFNYVKDTVVSGTMKSHKQYHGEENFKKK